MSTIRQDVFFGRIVNNAVSFSVASDGNTWTSIGAAYAYNVANGKGTVSGQSTNGYSTLGSSGITDCEVSCRVTPGTSSDGMGIVLRLAGINNHYRARFNATTFALVRDQANVLTVLNSASFTPTAGQAYWIRARAVGNGSGGADNLWAKIWQDGTAEPATWTVHASDSTFTSGSVGIFAAANSSSDILTYDSFYVTDGAENVLAVSSLLTTDTFLPPATYINPVDNLSHPSLSLGEGLSSTSGTDCPYGITYFANVAAGTSNHTSVDQMILDVQQIASNAWVRYQLDLYKIFPNATYNSTTKVVTIGAGVWTQLDDAVSRFNAAGVKICFPLQMNTWGVSNLQTLDGCFNVVAGGATGAIYMDIGSTYGGGPNTTFQDVINVIVARYNGGSGSMGMIDAWQIMNEEGDTHTASGCNRDKQGTWVGQTIAATAPLINSIAPNALIGAAAVRRTPTGAISHVTNWLTNMVVAAENAVLGVMNRIKFWDFHYYRDDPTVSQDPSVDVVGSGTTSNPDTPSVARELAAIKAVIIAKGVHTDTQIWMGEFGYHLYDDGKCCSSQITCNDPTKNVNCCGPISATQAGTYIAGPTAGNGTSGYEQMRLNGGNKVLVYDIDPNATVHTLTGCPSDAIATQWSNDPDSITQTINGTYQGTAAYNAIVAYAGAWPSWNNTIQTNVYSPKDNQLSTSRQDTFMDTYNPEEDLVGSRIRLFENIFAPIDSIPAKSSLLAIIIAIPADGLSSNETISSQDSYIPLDANSASSAISHDGPYSTLEPLSLLESVTITATYTSIETGPTVSDSISTPVITFNTITSEDDLVITESMLTTLVYRPQKQLNAKDTFTGTPDTSPGSIEALSLTESVAYIAGAIPIESLTGLESITQQDILTCLESLSVADSSTMLAGVSTSVMSSTDSLSMTESIAYLGTIIPTESISALSNLGAISIDLPQDAMSAVSSLAITITPFMAEALSMVDSATYADTTLLINVESANLTFTLIETDTLLLVDGLSMGGSVIWQEELAPSEVMSLNELLLYTEAYVPPEQVPTSDVYLANEAMSVLESLTISSGLSQSPSPIFLTSLSALDLLLTAESYNANDALSVSDAYLPVRIFPSSEALSINEQESTLTSAQWTEGLSGLSLLLATKPQAFVEALVASDSLTSLAVSAQVKEAIDVTWRTRSGRVTWRAR